LQRVIARVEVAEMRRFGQTGLGLLYRHKTLLLTTTGRRSGLPRSTPLSYLPLADGWLISGGAGGQARTPDWVENLRADPSAIIAIDRLPVEVVASELSGNERADAWTTLTSRWPQLNSYERRAGRTVPVFRLDRAGPRA
jgi:deazaflavin-dependent oxidoreductase (nitroreductase family)